MFTLLFLTMAAMADEPDTVEEPKVVYSQKTEIDFEAVEIEGILVKPQGAIILERRSTAFNPLIRLRTDFNHEMNLSVQEIK